MVPFTWISLPAVPDMLKALLVGAKSGVGRAPVVAVPAASWTRKYLPGWIDPCRISVPDGAVVDAAEAYCNE